MAEEVFTDCEEQKVDLMEEDFVAAVRIFADAGKRERVFGVLGTMSELIYTMSSQSLEQIQQIFSGTLSREASMVGIDIDVGRCSHCGLSLNSLDLTDAELSDMLGQIEGIARVGDKQKQSFDAFKNWLSHNGPHDVVIDGANVGFFNARPDQGESLSYAQVDRVVQWYIARNQKPLLVMHCRHFSDQARMSHSDREKVDGWKRRKILYSTPPKMNDDWFWLFAGVWATKQAKKGSLFMVSNDQMRDHHFQMLSTRNFLKWRERHWVNFHFTDKGSVSEPCFAFPSKYSVRGQLAKPNRSDLWHFPSSDNAGQWLCCAKEKESKEKE